MFGSLVLGTPVLLNGCVCCPLGNIGESNGFRRRCFNGECNGAEPHGVAVIGIVHIHTAAFFDRDVLVDCERELSIAATLNFIRMIEKEYSRFAVKLVSDLCVKASMPLFRANTKSVPSDERKFGMCFDVFEYAREVSELPTNPLCELAEHI